MKSKILIGMLALIVLAGIVTAIDVYKSPYPYAGSSIYTDILRTGPHRISDYDPRILDDYHLDTYVYLDPPEEAKWTRGYPPFAPRATAEILSTRSKFTPKSQVVVSTKDIEPSYKFGGVYEVWLYDIDGGYKLSLGIFRASMGGVGVLDYRGNNYLDQYEYVVITREPFPDNDPLPSEIVLVGPINKYRQDYYRPFAMQEEHYGYTQ